MLSKNTPGFMWETDEESYSNSPSESDDDFQEDRSEQTKDAPVGECSICLGEMYSHSRAILSNCLHVFCLSCIVKWSESYSKLCPLCKAPLIEAWHSILSPEIYEKVSFFFLFSTILVRQTLDPLGRSLFSF